MSDKKLTGDPRKDFGWFSRDHETSTAHLAARTRWQAEHGKEAKREMGAERQSERANRTPQEQIAILDRRLGVGQGAVKERKRLLNPVPKPEPEPKRRPMTKAEIAAGVEAYNPANMW